MRTTTDYSDMAFARDLARKSEQLNRMVARALREHQARLTMPFPPTCDTSSRIAGDDCKEVR